MLTATNRSGAAAGLFPESELICSSIRDLTQASLCQRQGTQEPRALCGVISCHLKEVNGSILSLNPGLCVHVRAACSWGRCYLFEINAFTITRSY